MSVLPPLMSLLGVRALPVVNTLAHWLKSTSRSRVCADLNNQDWIRSSLRFGSSSIYQDRIGFEFSTQISSNVTWICLGNTPSIFSLQTDDHTVPYHLVFLWTICSSWCQTNSVKVLKANFLGLIMHQKHLVAGLPWTIWVSVSCGSSLCLHFHSRMCSVVLKFIYC